MWTQSTSVTDRQTDGRTDGRTDRITITDTVQTASHGKNPLSYLIRPTDHREHNIINISRISAKAFKLEIRAMLMGGITLC